MTYYLLSVIQPSEGEPPAAEELARIVGSLDRFHEELREAGAWVFAGGLHGPESAAVLRLRGADVVVTEGPFTAGKEYLGGLCVIKASDRDEALEWGRKASRASTLPIEVRPFLHPTDA
ncbi:YciI family protein [Streptomyces mexicanus]|jgi:hypothetical protein|uniref:YciI family protein n=1 Tax=Streptomyces mexicanus TaxID=178566 RepID=UPI0031EBF12A